MQRIFMSSAALTLSLLALSPGAWAHRTWLLPSATQVEGKEPWVTFDAAVSEDLFAFSANALPLNGLRARAPDGSLLQPQNAHTGKLRSSFDLQLAQPGTYRVSLLGESVMATYKVGSEVKRWRGASDALAAAIPANATELKVSRTLSRLETFVTSGKASDATLKPEGQGLEVLPLVHPSGFQPGQPATFRVLLDGQPQPGLTVAVIPGDVRYRGVLREQVFTTNAQGEFAVTWALAGMHQLATSYPPRPAQPDAGAQTASPPAMPERRYTYGGTFEVLPE